MSAMFGDLISGVSGAMTSLYRRVSGQPSKAHRPLPVEAVKRRRRPARLSGQSTSSHASERVFLRSNKEKCAKRESLFKLEDIKKGDFIGVCYWDIEPYYGICKEVNKKELGNEKSSIVIQFYRRSTADLRKEVSDPKIDSYLVKRKDIDTLSEIYQGEFNAKILNEKIYL